MESANVLTFTDANFASEVERSDKPVLVDFWAEWCQPCRMLGPAIAKVADEFAGRAKVGKVNIESDRGTATRLGVQSIPAIFLFHQGRVVKRWVGLTKADEFSRAISEVAPK